MTVQREASRMTHRELAGAMRREEALLNYSCGHKPWMGVCCVECRPDVFPQHAALDALTQREADRRLDLGVTGAINKLLDEHVGDDWYKLDNRSWEHGVLAALRKLTDPSVPTRRDHVVYLIERGQAVNHAPTLWWRGPGPHDYTPDPNAAVRFRERGEAQRTLERQGMHFVESARVTEHVFLDAPGQTGPGSLTVIGDDEEGHPKPTPAAACAVWKPEVTPGTEHLPCQADGVREPRICIPHGRSFDPGAERCAGFKDQPPTAGGVTRGRIWHAKRTQDESWTPLCGAELEFNGVAYQRAGVTCEACLAILDYHARPAPSPAVRERAFDRIALATALRNVTGQATNLRLMDAPPAIQEWWGQLADQIAKEYESALSTGEGGGR